MTYAVDPTNTASPADSDPFLQAAEEFRTLKAYLATQFAALGGPVVAWNNRPGNVVINPDFNQWTNSTLDPDGWKTSVSGLTLTKTRTAHVVGQTAVPGEPRYYMTFTPSANSGISNYGAVDFVVEDVRRLAGRTVTLTFYAQAASGTPSISAEGIQNFGTGGTPTTEVNTISVTKWALGLTFAKYTLTLTFPSILGATLGTDDNSYSAIRFWLSAGTNFSARSGALGNQAIGISFSRIYMTEGGVSLAFEPWQPAIERAMCARYNQQYGGGINMGLCMGAATTTSVVSGILPLDYPMRAIPTAAIVGAASNFQATLASPTAATSMALTPISTKAIRIDLTASGTPFTVGRAYRIEAANANGLINVTSTL